jgi:hypothetical protein
VLLLLVVVMQHQLALLPTLLLALLLHHPSARHQPRCRYLGWQTWALLGASSRCCWGCLAPWKLRRS